ncbi:MAG: Hsp20/alpha crystallin family protein [Candidatus Latescibacteria bacterium]|nr:Hsp20/alpha crystallin family protein [Candidatus Latescibacterota bacterium]
MTFLRVAPGLRRDDYASGRTDSTYTPSVDIVENADGFTVDFDLPGFTREDLKVSVNEGVLTVTGTRARKEMDGDEKYFRHFERPYGTFSRSFRLPDYVNDESVNAVYVHGVLTLELQKKEEARPHTIEIK